jgi:hypothetical protein
VKFYSKKQKLMQKFKMTVKKKQQGAILFQDFSNAIISNYNY